MAEPLWGRLSLRSFGKTNFTVPDEGSGRAPFLALRVFSRRLLSLVPVQSRNEQGPVVPDVDAQEYSPELRGLIGTLKAIRHRILANTLLLGWTKWSVWVLIGLIALALAESRLGGGLLFVAILALLGAAAILVWTWQNRPSAYDAARQLDSAADLKDRTSTAIYLGVVKDHDGMIEEQRRDALSRVAKVDARGLFPLRWPGNLRGALVLVLLAAGLFAYRVHHKAPLVSLLQTTARSRLVQSILAPIVHEVEKDLQRTMALVTMKPDAIGDETRRGDSVAGDEDLWKGSDDKAAEAKDNQQDAAEAGDLPQDQLQAPGDQDTPPSGDANQEESNSQSQEGKNSDNSNGKSQQSEQQGAENRQSLGQSLMQALKNMMSNSPNQQTNNRANQQPPNGQGTPQSGNSHQPGTTESDKRGESRGNSDAKQKATQTASEGAGSQQGNKELRKDQDAHPVNAVPDRVALEASGFKEQTRMNVATETGTAQLASRDQSLQGDAVVNGAEQENIPARYRLYVQRYFEHADNGTH